MNSHARTCSTCAARWDSFARSGDAARRLRLGRRARGAPGEAGFGEFPWIVAILHKTAGKKWSPREYIGGGSIIHQSVVLTAAHKVAGQNLTKLKCRAGEWDAGSESEELPHQDRDIAEIVKHEGYSRRLVTNSIALIFLKTPFDLSHYWHVGGACVGRQLPPPGTHCLATGWGKRAHGPKGQYARVLKKVSVPIVSSAECEFQLRGTKLGAQFALHPSLTCAGGAGADACTGDGGAPLVCRLPDTGHRYSVVGMAAWGVGCGALPGVYVSVPPFRAWLADVMAAHGYGDRSYQHE
ncbi:phenoloxidase-activating factor 2-like [Choristoneura fumiferana]|uniref:phenoloxidase-activating factor 2-like n=1 Tax=Choristoneura fumiferana TaxID=7141 RepID=UPI003D15C128